MVTPTEHLKPETDASTKTEDTAEPNTSNSPQKNQIVPPGGAPVSYFSAASVASTQAKGTPKQEVSAVIFSKRLADPDSEKKVKGDTAGGQTGRIMANAKVPFFPNEFRRDFWKELVYLKDQNWGSAPNHLKEQLTKQKLDKKIFMLRPSVLSPEQPLSTDKQPDRLRAIFHNPATQHWRVRELQPGEKAYHFASIALITDCYLPISDRRSKKVIQLRLAYNKEELMILAGSGDKDLINLNRALGELNRVLYIGKIWVATAEQNPIQAMIQELFSHGFEAAISTEALQALKATDKDLQLDEDDITSYAGSMKSAPMSSLGSENYAAVMMSSQHVSAACYTTSSSTRASVPATSASKTEAPEDDEITALQEAELYNNDLSVPGPVTAKPEADDSKKKKRP